MKTCMNLLFSALMVAIGAGCASRNTSPLPPPTVAAANREPVFELGDKVELYVDEDPTFNETYVVREGGYILVPRIGRIRVQGLNRTAAEAHIRAVFEKAQLRHATITVERNSGGWSNDGRAGGPQMALWFTGSVAKPGVNHVPILPGHRLGVSEALLLTGGVGKFADITRVELLRADAGGRRQKAVIDLRAIRAGKADDVPCGEGDIINVPERVFGF